MSAHIWTSADATVQDINVVLSVLHNAFGIASMHQFLLKLPKNSQQHYYPNNHLFDSYCQQIGVL